MAQNDEYGSWHLDKRVPIALIFTMIGQGAVVVWLAAVMFKDIEVNRDNIDTLNGRLVIVERGMGQQAVQLGRIEENVRAMRDDISRLINIMEERFRP